MFNIFGTRCWIEAKVLMSRYRLPAARGRTNVVMCSIPYRRSAVREHSEHYGKQTCDREREWSRVHSFMAIVSMLINDALDAREQTSYTQIRNCRCRRRREEKQIAYARLWFLGRDFDSVLRFLRVLFWRVPLRLSDALLIISLITPINAIATDDIARVKEARSRGTRWFI